MSTYKEPDLEQRQNAAKTAKTAMLHKFRVASEDPAVAERQAERLRVNEARLARLAQREAAKRLQEAQLAEQAARNAELALQAQQEAAKVEALMLAEKAANEAMLEAERKAARDARYAARKAAKKIRRRGY
jgi:Family of unknown function (DUF6481)